MIQPRKHQPDEPPTLHDDDAGPRRRAGHRGSLSRIEGYESNRAVWQVSAGLETGEVYDEYVIAQTAEDAATVLGDWIRARHGVEPGDEVGISSIYAISASSIFSSRAMNV